MTAGEAEGPPLGGISAAGSCSPEHGNGPGSAELPQSLGWRCRVECSGILPCSALQKPSLLIRSTTLEQCEQGQTCCRMRAVLCSRDMLALAG